MTEKEKLVEYLKNEIQNNGLLDFKVFKNLDTINVNVSEEELFAEINRMINAPVIVEDPDFF